MRLLCHAPSVKPILDRLIQCCIYWAARGCQSSELWGLLDLPAVTVLSPFKTVILYHLRFQGELSAPQAILPGGARRPFIPLASDFRPQPFSVPRLHVDAEHFRVLLVRIAHHRYLSLTNEVSAAALARDNLFTGDRAASLAVEAYRLQHGSAPATYDQVRAANGIVGEEGEKASLFLHLWTCRPQMLAQKYIADAIKPFFPQGLPPASRPTSPR